MLNKPLIVVKVIYHLCQPWHNSILPMSSSAKQPNSKQAAHQACSYCVSTRQLSPPHQINFCKRGEVVVCVWTAPVFPLSSAPTSTSCCHFSHFHSAGAEWMKSAHSAIPGNLHLEPFLISNIFSWPDGSFWIIYGPCFCKSMFFSHLSF